MNLKLKKKKLIFLRFSKCPDKHVPYSPFISQQLKVEVIVTLHFFLDEKYEA